MKLVDLKEGLIKIPVELLQTTWSWVLKIILLQLEIDVEEADLSSKDKLAMQKIIYKIAEEQQVDIDEEVKSVLQAKKKFSFTLIRDINFEVIVFFNKSQRLSSNDAGAYDLEQKQILLQPAAKGITALNIKSKDALERNLKQLGVTLEHELTHVLQDQVYGKIDPKQKIRDLMHSEVIEGGDAYYLSKHEFDPHVKKCISDANELVKQGYKRDEIIKELNNTKFLKTLKRYKHAKWQDAMKLITKEVQWQ